MLSFLITAVTVVGVGLGHTQARSCFLRFLVSLAMLVWKSALHRLSMISSLKIDGAAVRRQDMNVIVIDGSFALLGPSYAPPIPCISQSGINRFVPDRARVNAQDGILDNFRVHIKIINILRSSSVGGSLSKNFIVIESEVHAFNFALLFIHRLHGS